jgi:hypothetical protein
MKLHEVRIPGDGTSYSLAGVLVWRIVLFALALSTGTKVWPTVVAARAGAALIDAITAAAMKHFPELTRYLLVPSICAFGRDGQ